MTETPCEKTELAALHALGSLPPLERQAYEAHLASGCEACAAELDTARDTAARLDLKVAELANESAPAGLKDELMSRIREQDPRPWRRWTSQGRAVAPGLTTVDGDEGAWEETDFDGVRVRPLSVDEERRFVTMLVKMDPGASYPPHRHAGREECYVLEGDLQVADTQMTAGDFQVAEEGSVHGIQSTRGGCTLLIVSSQDDVLIA